MLKLNYIIILHKEYIYNSSRLGRSHQQNELKFVDIIVSDLSDSLALEIFLFSCFNLAKKIVTLNINAGQPSEQSNERNE